jgi:hypothetical protein
VEAGLCVAVVDGGSAPVIVSTMYRGWIRSNIPAILRAAFIRSTLGISILGSAVASESPRHQRQDSESSETHIVNYD